MAAVCFFGIHKMKKTRYVSNPASPAGLRPVQLITDRAKRYRAQAAAPPKGNPCYLCGAKNPRDVEHIDGNEANTHPANIDRACRSCNTRKGQTFARNGHGTRTRQYNPANGKQPRQTRRKRNGTGAQSLGQYLTAIMVLKGESDAMDLNAAIAMMHNTPQADRSSFAREIWNRRGRREAVPF